MIEDDFDALARQVERMELNEEWLDAHLATPPPRLLHGMLAERERPEAGD